MANTKDTAAAAKTYSFATAKAVLTDTEKERCLALFLNCDHKSVRPPSRSPSRSIPRYLPTALPFTQNNADWHGC